MSSRLIELPFGLELVFPGGGSGMTSAGCQHPEWFARSPARTCR